MKTLLLAAIICLSFLGCVKQDLTQTDTVITSLQYVQLPQNALNYQTEITTYQNNAQIGYNESGQLTSPATNTVNNTLKTGDILKVYFRNTYIPNRHWSPPYPVTLNPLRVRYTVNVNGKMLLDFDKLPITTDGFNHDTTVTVTMP